MKFFFLNLLNLKFILKLFINLIYAQSSATGPAEQFAGGSFSKSCNSFYNYLQFYKFFLILIKLSTYFINSFQSHDLYLLKSPNLLTIKCYFKIKSRMKQSKRT